MGPESIPDDPARTAGFGELESDWPYDDPMNREPPTDDDAGEAA